MQVSDKLYLMIHLISYSILFFFDSLLFLIKIEIAGYLKVKQISEKKKVVRQVFVLFSMM